MAVALIVAFVGVLKPGISLHARSAVTMGTRPAPQNQAASTRRELVGASLALLSTSALLARPAGAAPAKEILVEGEVAFPKLAAQLAGKRVRVEVIARRLGKGVIATTRIEQAADTFPSRFSIYADDLNEGISLDKTRADDIFLLATLDSVESDGSLRRLGSLQGKAPLKKGERLKPLLLIE
ncbi:hypothetical protein T492DRAFT_1004512, partial [Pavlovales sp. CCMP2436]